MTGLSSIMSDFWTRWRGSAREVSETPMLALPPPASLGTDPAQWTVLHDALGGVAEDTRQLGRGQVRLHATVSAVDGRLDQLLERVGLMDEEQGRRVLALQAAVESLGWQMAATWVRDLLPVLDGLRDAETAQPNSPLTWRARLARWLMGSTPEPDRKDVRVARERLEGALLARGVREIPATGQAFDPEVHVAIGFTPAAPPGQVHAVGRPGFTLEGRVLRPSEVVVGT